MGNYTLAFLFKMADDFSWNSPASFSIFDYCYQLYFLLYTLHMHEKTIKTKCMIIRCKAYKVTVLFYFSYLRDKHFCRYLSMISQIFHYSKVDLRYIVYLLIEIFGISDRLEEVSFLINRTRQDHQLKIKNRFQIHFLKQTQMNYHQSYFLLPIWYHDLNHWIVFYSFLIFSIDFGQMNDFENR